MTESEKSDISEAQMREYLAHHAHEEPENALESLWKVHEMAMRKASEVERGKMAKLFGEYGMHHLREAIDPDVERMLQSMEAVYDDVGVISDRIQPKVAEVLTKAGALNISERGWDMFRLKLTTKFENTLEDHTKLPMTLEMFFRKLQAFGVPAENLAGYRERLIEKWEVFLRSMLNDPTIPPERIKLRISDAEKKYDIPPSVLEPFKARLEGNSLPFLKKYFGDTKNRAPGLTAVLNDAVKAGVKEAELAPFRIHLADAWESHLKEQFEEGAHLSERRELIELARRGGLDEARLKKFRDQAR